MTDNELLLLSISNIMDTKLKYIESRMDTMEGNLNRRIDGVEGNLNRRIDGVEENLNRCIDGVEENLNRCIDGLEDSLNAKIHRTNLLLENQVLPRIKEIESCYLSTFERYQQETSKIEHLQLDVDIIKDVLIEHGEKLKCIKYVYHNITSNSRYVT